MLRRALATLICVAAAAFGFAERTTITVWGMGLGPDSKGLEAVIREFERRNPDIRVRVLSMGAGAMNPQKLMTAIVGRVPPDVINQDRFTINDWASRGAFMPLDDFIKRDWDDPLTPKPKQYYEAPWLEATFEGRVYGIPTGADTRIFYYNRSLFRAKAAELRAAGLDPERPPRTWEETLAYSRVLTERNPDGTLRTAGFIPNFGNSWLYLFAFQNEAYFMSPDGRTCTMFTPEAVEALEYMVEGYRILGGWDDAQKFTSGFLGNENDPFIIGKVAMKVDGDWILNGLNRFAPRLDFGVAPPPVPEARLKREGRFADIDHEFITWTGGFSLAIPTGARHPEAAWRYIKFATSFEGRMIEARAQAAWERRRGRAFIPRILAHRETNEQLFKEFRPATENFADALRMHIDLASASRVRPVTVVSQVLWDEHVRAIENAASGRMTPSEALRSGQRNIQRELDAHFSKEKLPVFDLRWPFAAGAGLVVAVAVGFLIYLRRQRLGKLAKTETAWAFLLIAPWLIGFLVFTLGPMIASFIFSFTQYNVLSEARWVGLGNYADLLGEDRDNIVKAFSNVFYLAGIGVPLGLVTSLAIAMLLNAAVRGIQFYRTFFYMPSIVPAVAGAVLWGWILTPDANKGLVNAGWAATIGQWFSLPPPGWLTVEDWAKPALILMGLWGAGGGMILWLAGLKGIPNQLYEAASIDGATPGKTFWTITLPQLSPVIFFNTVMGFIAAVQEFDRVYVLNRGTAGPGDSLLVPVLHLFVNGFNYFKMGYASALAWIVFALILALTLIQFKLAPKWVHYEADK